VPYAIIGNLKVHYRVRGEGPVLLLLHALGSCADDWRLQAPVLATRYTVLTPDLRGHGRTDKPPGPYTITQMADDVAGLLEELSVNTTDVVGLSLGGLVAQALATGHPELVRSLVLVNTFAKVRLRRRMLRRGLALLTGGLEAQAEIVAQDLFPRPGQEKMRRAAVERLRANDPAAYRAAMRAALRFDARRDLARIRVPTLVVAGARDTTVDMTAKEELAARIPGARLAVIANSGHVTPVDRPGEFNRLLLEFLPAGP